MSIQGIHWQSRTHWYSHMDWAYWSTPPWCNTTQGNSHQSEQHYHRHHNIYRLKIRIMNIWYVLLLGVCCGWGWFKCIGLNLFTESPSPHTPPHTTNKFITMTTPRGELAFHTQEPYLFTHNLPGGFAIMQTIIDKHGSINISVEKCNVIFCYWLRNHTAMHTTTFFIPHSFSHVVPPTRW